VIRAVTFDADGTLWDFESAMHYAQTLVLADLQARLPQQAADLTVDRLMAIREDVAAELEPRGATLIQIRLVAFERTLELIGAPDAALAARLNTLYLHHRQEATRLYDDTLLALDDLVGRRPLVLGIISNGNTDHVRCGLGDHFQFALFADQYGASKPHRRMFDVALELAACEPFEVLHVGDSLTHDVAGAQSLGIGGVWLNRDGLKNRTGIVPDYEIRSLLELPALVR
jgi:FMN hydrolase / 5-amino-6-(5-phospho-D-ribitylamino)uracil phosphatase